MTDKLDHRGLKRKLDELPTKRDWNAMLGWSMIIFAVLVVPLSWGVAWLAFKGLSALFPH